MSYRNKLVLINASVFLLFVGLSVCFSVQLVKGSYDEKIEMIKSEIIGKNTKLTETFLHSQEALLEEKAQHILQEIKYLSLVFESKCIQGYPRLSSMSESLDCINKTSTDYIEGVSFVDLKSNIEITKSTDNKTVISSYVSKNTTAWGNENSLKAKIVKNGIVRDFYILYPISKHSKMKLKFKIDLDVFSRSLTKNKFNHGFYKFLLVDRDGNFITSTLTKDFKKLLNSKGISGEETLRDYILSRKLKMLTINYDDENYNLIQLRNDVLDWSIILISPESYIRSSYVSTRDLLLSFDESLVKNITVLSLFLFVLFLGLIYFTVIKSFRPVNKLIKQANYLKDQDFIRAMDVISHGGDEIEMLSQAYSNAGRTIKQLVEGLENEVKVRTEQYEAAAQKALVANQKKSVLLSNVSHEIRTPLNAIVGYSDILRKHDSIGEFIHELDGISTASTTILDIVNDLLDFERLDSINYTLHPKYVSIGKISKEIERTFLPLAKAKDISLSIKKYDFDCYDQLYIDELRFKQAISNVISNAIKFTDVGKVEIIISKTKIINDEMLCFEVRDTGRGILKKNIDSIFNSFEQVNQEDMQFGFGLGLAITKAIIDLMKGKIIVESEIGKGSSFKLGLPISVLSRNENLPEDNNAISYEIDNLIEHFEGKWALVVDDVEFNREVLGHHLSEIGVQFKSAVDGVDALNILETERFDVILTDVSMPNMDGVELAKQCKQKYANLPIIAVTARATVQEEEMMSHYFDNYITKPIDKTMLVTALSLTFE
ncbi:ATP-binding protein [Vibrio campbellii]